MWVLKSELALLEILGEVVGVQWLDAWRNLTQDEAGACRRSNSHNRCVTTAVTLEKLRLTEDSCEFLRTFHALVKDMLVHVLVQLLCFSSFERDHLALQVRVPAKYTNTNCTVTHCETTCVVHERDTFGLVDVFLHNSIEEHGENTGYTGVLPILIMQQVQRSQAANERLICGRWQSNFHAHIAGVDLHVVVAVNSRSATVYVVCEEDVWVARLETLLDDTCPQLTLGLITGNHFLHPSIANADTQG
ncbi:hypothetical protein D3C71_970340 [compost metagenome]